VSGFVRNEKLRQALSFHTLLVGGNPMTTSAIYALIHKLERDGGVWFAKGGTNRLVEGMARHFQRLGGTLRLGDPVVAIDARSDRVTGVTCQSGWHGDFDAIASNGDVVRSYDLLGRHRRGVKAAARLRKKRFSPSLFVLHLGVRGEWRDIPHHNILFGPRYQGLLGDIYDRGQLPDDPSLYVHHPTVTDPDMAPAGCSTFYALAPVPHLGKLDIDWGTEGTAYAERILSILEARLMPGLRSRIELSFHYTPQDFADDLGAHLGSAFSLEPLLTQSAFFRVHNRDDELRNLYFVGAGTHPGAGIPGVVGSAKATAGLMIDDLAA
jgi:phytoene desaturase